VTLSAAEPLRPEHDVASFDSGKPQLDNWLSQRAKRNEIEGASRTYVACDGLTVAGYYSLAASSIFRAAALSRIRKNMPEPIPVFLIGRLAIDQKYQGKGLGAGLLRDAMLRIFTASEIIGARAILVHAISEEAKAFYQRFGFAPSEVEPLTLMIMVSDARKMLANG